MKGDCLFREQTAGDRMLFHIAKDFERSALLKYKDVIVLTEVDRENYGGLHRTERPYLHFSGCGASG